MLSSLCLLLSERLFVCQLTVQMLPSRVQTAQCVEKAHCHNDLWSICVSKEASRLTVWLTLMMPYGSRALLLLSGEGLCLALCERIADVDERRVPTCWCRECRWEREDREKREREREERGQEQMMCFPQCTCIGWAWHQEGLIFA